MPASLRSAAAFTVRRCQILLASARGERTPQIARALSCDDQTVRNVIHAFHRRGLGALARGSCRPHTLHVAFDVATATKAGWVMVPVAGRVLVEGAKTLGHGKGYVYAHDQPGHFAAQDYLGASRRYYEPTEQGVEKKIKERVEKWRAQLDATRPK